MKLLLDESIPRKLSDYFPDQFEVFTVPQLGWAGTKNGELLKLAADHNFRALITADKGIEYQQNIATLPVTIVILIAHRTRAADLAPLVPRALEVLQQTNDIGVYRVAV